MSVWRIESRVNPQSENWRMVESTNDDTIAKNYVRINLTLGWKKFKITKLVEDLPSL